MGVTEGGGGVKNCPNLCDVIYECPLSSPKLRSRMKRLRQVTEQVVYLFVDFLKLELYFKLTRHIFRLYSRQHNA